MISVFDAKLAGVETPYVWSVSWSYLCGPMEEDIQKAYYQVHKRYISWKCKYFETLSDVADLNETNCWCLKESELSDFLGGIERLCCLKFAKNWSLTLI